MAQHIQSIAASGIAKVSKAEMYQSIRFGDLFFCSGREMVSKGIEAVTGSPFSHVGFLWLPNNATEWLTLEATIQHGVHVGRFADYADSYNGDIAIARRGALPESDQYRMLNKGFTLLDFAYDWQQEATIVAHKLIAALPVIHPKQEYYCSGLMWALSLVSSLPLQKPSVNFPTPEDNWTDPSVEPVCAVLKG
jgi:hypothetical protein